MSPVKRALFIGHVWPEPRSSAAGARSMDLIQALQAWGWQVTVSSAAQLSPHRADLSALGIDELEIRLNCDSFNAQLAKLQPELVIFDRFLSEEQFSWRVEEVCPEALRVLDTQDLHSLREARQQAIKRGGEPELHSELAQRELAAIWRSDLSLIISDYEMSLLQQHYGVSASLLHYYPLLSEGRQPASDFDGRKHCLCIGNYRHAPNWDALQYLRRDIWPALRKRLPEAECHVYGAYPPPKAMQLHNDKLGFLIKGWAPDARAVMRDAKLCLAPLRFGAGQKGKLLEAMECGTPSVTSAVGAEGMGNSETWGGYLADTPEAFVDACVALYRDATAWQQAQQRGDALLTRFDRQSQLRQLRERLSTLSVERDAGRKANFIGAMLRHHSLRSHRYMSQWIAAKNRFPTAE
ncbi:glycosyltransferase family 4 protein [Spongiibacter tropicus]|uniref:glycosyltransferase family 4 protein n=1 Tax=Spongiibacter tropicus TaxID=454602 RepID=UPI002355BB8B|nr:glycosyltransferase family 4 protein [Spongiibacter tropicus]|tara:strand:- start:15203 stop:16429 length:1227 start_codon:yes stop_codon:yes gene_type:complete